MKSLCGSQYPGQAGRIGSSPHCSGVLGEAITKSPRAKKSCLFAQVFVLSGILFCSQRWLAQLAHHQKGVVFILQENGLHLILF